MNVKAGIEALNKIVKRRSESQCRVYIDESSMRLKVSDLRHILEAMHSPAPERPKEGERFPPGCTCGQFSHNHAGFLDCPIHGNHMQLCKDQDECIKIPGNPGKTKGGDYAMTADCSGIGKAQEEKYICSQCGKETSPFDDDHYQVCKPKAQDECKHGWYYDANEFGTNSKHYTCIKCRIGKWEEKPAQSLTLKIIDFFCESNNPHWGKREIDSLAKIAESHYAPIIAQARKEGYDQGWGNAVKSNEHMYLDAKKSAREELKEKFDSFQGKPFICKEHLRDELFGD